MNREKERKINRRQMSTFRASKAKRTPYLVCPFSVYVVL
jgi:hypothetical protein